MPSVYGILIAAGIVVSALFSEHLILKLKPRISIFKKTSSNPIIDAQSFWSALFYVLIGAFIGARMYHVAHYWEYYGNNLNEIYKTWNGGMGIYGAIAGGVFGLLVYAYVFSNSFIKSYRGRKPNTLKTVRATLLAYSDYFALSLPLAQAIGRWGNYFNNELFGKPSNLPWAIFIPFDSRPSSFKLYETYHPLFLYESVLDLILFFVLLSLIKRGKQSGFVFFSYLFGYALIRLPLEALRINPWTIFGVPTASVASLFLIVFSLGYFLFGYLTKRRL